MENETSVEEVAHTYCISRGMLYNWKSKYSGMDVSQVMLL
ncbi:MAG: transposase [Prevotella sp.]|nr:transposase [Prevotella sp.]MCH4017959.1 transposase [Prevotella sp.]MCH4100845.1 transposase [Prevotella sp.]MCH4252045.1 transposase [Prevotella sp.]MCI1324433.1 transposase [Prevotella sp.]